MHTPHLAWHLSGGTTELLLVKPDANNVSAERIGGTTDISAGQLIDRTGNLLGLGFPAGKAVDEMSLRSIKNDTFRVKVHDCQFSLSGMENKVRALVEQGEDGCNVARFALSVLLALSALQLLRRWRTTRATRLCFLEVRPQTPCCGSGLRVPSFSFLRQSMPRTTPWGSPFSHGYRRACLEYCL